MVGGGGIGIPVNENGWKFVAGKNAGMIDGWPGIIVAAELDDDDDATTFGIIIDGNGGNPPDGFCIFFYVFLFCFF